MSVLPSNQSGFARIFAIFIIFSLLIGLTFFSIHKTSSASTDFVSASGTKLFLHGQEYKFTGVNAFNLATLPGYNAGCGGYTEDLDSFFSKLRPNSAVRMWAFQGAAAFNPNTRQLDWSGLDRVVNAAQKNGKKLILVLGNQDGHCDDGHYKDKNWYLGGYKQAFNDSGNGLTPMPYLDYVKAVVTRYKDVPAIAMWEPINEPAAGECVSGTGYECYSNLKCSDEPGSAAALKSFFDSIGSTIKSIDGNHLISSGALGNGQCGTVYEDYQFVHSSSGIDVGSFHDYDHVDEALPGDEWNGLQKRINQMQILSKPIYIGEVGMIAGGSNCMSLSDRNNKMKVKMDAQFGAGIAGFTPWSYTGGGTSGCNYDIGGSDPMLTLLRDYPVSMSTANPAALYTPFPTPLPTPDAQPPAPPANLTITNLSTNQVTFNWTEATDNKKIDRYEVYRDYSYITAVWTTSYTDSNVSPGKSYKYYLKARDSSGNSSEMSSILIVNTPYSGPTPTPTPTPTPLPPDTQPPTAPTSIVQSNLTPTSVTLTWSGATDNQGIDRYEVYKDWGYVTAVWGNSYTFTNLTPGKSYLFYVKTRDKAGLSSAESVKLTVTTPNSPSPTSSSSDTQPPSPATNLKIAVLSPTQIRLGWTAATDNVGVSRYEIYRDYSYIGIAWGTSFTVSNLTPGKNYMFYIKTRDLAGNSSGSSIKVNVTMPLN